jgi:hypothetical protein
MPHLPAHFAGIILWFARLFVHLSWRHAQALLIGAIFRPPGAQPRGMVSPLGRPHPASAAGFYQLSPGSGPSRIHPTRT